MANSEHFRQFADLLRQAKSCGIENWSVQEAMFSNALEWAEHFEDLAERDPVGLKRELKLYNRKLRSAQCRSEYYIAPVSFRELECASHLLLKSTLSSSFISPDKLGRIMDAYLALAETPEERVHAADQLHKDVCSRGTNQAVMNVILRVISEAVSAHQPIQRITLGDGTVCTLDASSRYTSLRMSQRASAALMRPYLAARSFASTASEPSWMKSLRRVIGSDDGCLAMLVVMISTCQQPSTSTDKAACDQCHALLFDNAAPPTMLRVWNLDPLLLADASEKQFGFCRRYLDYLVIKIGATIKTFTELHDLRGSSWYSLYAKCDREAWHIRRCLMYLLADGRPRVFRQFTLRVLRECCERFTITTEPKAELAHRFISRLREEFCRMPS